MQNRKIDKAIKCLNTEFLKSSKYAHESKGYIHAAIALLTSFKAGKTESLAQILDKEIAIYTMGAVILAIAFHQAKYSPVANIRVSTDEKSEFYNQPYYPITWDKLCDTNYETTQEGTNDLIIQTGIKILYREIPFEPKKLIFLFPSLKEHIEATQAIIEGKKASMPSEEKKQYLVSLETMKQKIKDILTPYISSLKFHFFMFGPHHKDRARNVLAAINAAKDIETIQNIILHQNHILKREHVSQELIDKVDATGLSKRWSEVNQVKNIPRSNSTYLALVNQVIEEIQRQEKSDTSIYEEIMLSSPSGAAAAAAAATASHSSPHP